MAQRTPKKIYLNNPELIDALVEDASVSSGKTNSAIIEDAIISYFASTPFSRTLLLLIYKEDIFSALSAIYTQVDATYQFTDLLFETLRDIVAYTHTLTFNRKYRQLTDGELHDALICLEQLHSELVAHNNKLKEGPKTEWPPRDLHWAIKEIEVRIKEYNENPAWYQPSDFYSIVEGSWSVLKHCPAVPRLMRIAVNTISARYSEAEDRLRLLTLVNNLPEEWGV